MAEVQIRPLLAHTPERTPPGSWRIFLLPAVMALIGIFVANACMKAGQAEARRQTIAKFHQEREHLRNELHLTSDPVARAALIAQINIPEDDYSRLPSYEKPGRVRTRWDGYRYEEIIEGGYVYHLPTDPEWVQDDSFIQREGWPEKRIKNVVWYPLYPVLGYITSKVTGLKAHDALTVVSWCATIGAAVVFFAVARRHYFNRMPALEITPEEQHVSRRWDLQPPDTAAVFATTFVLYGPAAVFLYANYTESLFILLLGLFIFFIQRRNWWAAAAVAAVASGCRSQGVLFGPVLALTYLMRSDVKSVPVKLGTAVALGMISAIGIACYILYLGYKFQSPFAFMEAQHHWGVGINANTISYAMNPVHGLQNFLYYVVGRPSEGFGVDWPRIWESFCVIAPPVLLMLLGARFLSFELEVVGWILWGLPYVSNSLGASDAETLCLNWMSMGRFMAVVLPLQVILGAILMRFRWAAPALIALSAAGFAILAYKFGFGAWVG